MPKANAFDKEGFLRDLSDWTEDIAQQIAEQEKIVLSENHWELVYLARKYHQSFEKSPEMRPLGDPRYLETHQKCSQMPQNDPKCTKLFFKMTQNEVFGCQDGFFGAPGGPTDGFWSRGPVFWGPGPSSGGPGPSFGVFGTPEDRL